MNKAYDRLVESGALTERQAQVWRVLLSKQARYSEGMTAREINDWLRVEDTERSGVHSRLRELEKIDAVVKGRFVNLWRSR